MNDNLDDYGQFKMRLDEEVEDSPISANVDDLRIEKLNHRVTLITILIPVLIVVVLVIAYLDMKKRVLQTEDTGQLTAASLAKDLESRFENVTLAQRVVEENIARLRDQSDQSVAKVQINLKKLDDRLKNLDNQLKSTGRKMASQKDLKDVKATSAKLDQSVGNVAQSIEELRIQVSQLSEAWQPQIAGLERVLAENKTQMTQLSQKLSTLDETKMDRDAMKLALKLEVLKLKQVQKVQIEELQSRLKSVERKVSRPAPRKVIPAPTPKASPAPTAPKVSPAPTSAPATPSTTPSGKLEEQTIGK